MKRTLRRMTLFAALAIFCGFLMQAPQARAQNLSIPAPETKHYLLAQSDPDEAFDPFSDYSEFDEASDEEADINFFRNGRFFTLGLVGGIRNFTGNFSKVYSQGPTYGLAITYFFDLRSALAISFITGDQGVNFTTNNGAKNYTGTVSLTSMNFDFKYYFNTQNVTRGLADLNPYGLLGFGQFYRTYSLDNIDGLSRDSAMGVDLGGGLEIPLMRKHGFLGTQFAYHIVSFSDAGKQFVNGNEKLDTSFSGSFYELTLILGMNF